MPTVTSASLGFRPMKAVGLFSVVVSFLLVFAPLLRAADPSAPANASKSFAIPAGPAETALKTFSEQSGRSVMFATEKVKGITTNEVKGDLPVEQALDQLLGGTKLSAVSEKTTGGFAIRRENSVELAEKNGSSRPASDRAASDSRTREDGTLVLDTFEVMGTKLLNMDLRRSADDPQPYVVFERRKIEQSGASNIEDFLKQRLTMNTQAQTNSQTIGQFGDSSQINLRGLGANQTLILVDGHRVSGATVVGLPQQPSINGIPIAAVERIEVLPATASGIYGGGATGGVINIILRRDYAGVEINVSYENTFDSDAAIRRIAFNAGFTLEGGKTSILLAASYTDPNRLLVQDRDFVPTGRARIFANNPNFIMSGTPLLGGTTNIRSLNRSNLKLANGTPLNSPYTFVPVGYTGITTDGGAAFVANAGRHDFSLADSVRGGRQGLLNTPTVAALSATIRRQFSSKLQAFLDVSASNNTGDIPFTNVSSAFVVPAAAPNNPFGQSLLVNASIPTADGTFRVTNYDRRAVAGVIVQLPWDWKAEADYTWDRLRYQYSQPSYLNGSESAALVNGAINLLRDTNLFPVELSPYLAPPPQTNPTRSTLQDFTVRAAGPIFALPGGDLTVSGSLEHRREAFGAGTLPLNATLALSYPDTFQSTSSAYLEAKVPIFSRTNTIPGVEELEFQVAGRHDRYRVNGVTSGFLAGSNPLPTRAANRIESTDPTIGLRYRPMSDLALRASYGTGFLPPNVSQLVTGAATQASGGSLVDPKRGNTAVGSFQFLSGGNPNLRPENSKSISAGFILSPRAFEGFRLSVDYTRIEKTDNISTLTVQQVIDNEDALPGRVTRGPITSGDPFTVGPVTFVNVTSVNVARAEVEAVDFMLSYFHDTGRIGTFDFFIGATRQMHYKTQVVATVPLLENVGISSNNPLKLKANAGLTWARDGWTFSWNARYFDSYLVSSSVTVILNQGDNGRVPSQIYHDFVLGYRFDPAGTSRSTQSPRLNRVLAGTEIQVGIKNAFNHVPPFDASNASFFYSAFGDPRLASYFVSVKRAF